MITLRVIPDNIEKSLIPHYDPEVWTDICYVAEVRACPYCGTEEWVNLWSDV